MEWWEIAIRVIAALIIIPVVGLFLYGLFGTIADEIIKWLESRKDQS